jgi:uncharacterized phage protein (TIGR01671 family)
MITPPNVFIGAGSSAEIIEIALDGRVSKRNAYGLDVFSKNPAFDEPEAGLILQQYTGLKDKNGKEIYEGDALRVKGIMGEAGQYSFDAIYKVNNLDYKGVSLSFLRLYNQEPDSVQNSYPILQSLSFYHNSLTYDYCNVDYDKLAIRETWGENSLYRTRWKQHHYTNDIEIIGNIYENPELLTANP